LTVEQNTDEQAVTLEAVVNGSVENASFFKYTPAGRLTLAVVNKDVQFEEGKEYYLDISPAS
jgi:hypothetical protein